MSDIRSLVARVESGPQGPDVGAFFDFDGTLIAGYSALAFLKYRLRKREIPIDELVKTIGESIDYERHSHDVGVLMHMGVEAQAGRSVDEFEAWSRKVFAREIAKMLYPDVRELIQAHSDAGHTLAIASSATRYQVEPTAADLGIDNLICTEMGVDSEGKITGKLAGPIRWGYEKAAGVEAFARDREISLASSYAYSNGFEDLPLLESVGHPTALNPDDELEKTAVKRHWPVARLTQPAKPNAINAIRTVAGLGAFGLGIATGSLFGILGHNRRFGANVASAIAPDLALSIAGVRLNIVGRENLWKARPAVFLFNHQSQLEVLVLGALLRRNFTGVAKKQLAHDPFFAPIGYMADVAYIDRANNAAARVELEPVVKALKHGRSLVIAPEGTRSPTAKLLPFKKGPFHIAIQANVPIVPIVLRNAGELMPPHSYVITPGTLDVAVLPPVHPDGWNHDNLDQHIAEVRQMYVDTLSHWPTSED
ncbi:MAG: HAD-IB family hydrolase [Candidatus Nanopelagicales bacterium]|nr:HAD-IB family hydrolase [Candidatus Nanopelagicales bacterium]